MVEIINLGHAAFKFTGKTISVITDPFQDAAVGLKFPRVEADVVTISHDHDDHNNREGIKGDYICFDSPGEYEIKGAEIVGIRSYHDEKKGEERGQNTIFVYALDDIKICHLGDLGHELTSEQIEKIDGIDVLIIPVGGKYTIDAKQAAKVVAAIGPKIVLPAHYKIGKMTDLGAVDDFLKEMGAEAKKVSELKIKQKELADELEFYLLTLKAK
ncbi:MBL fold metallo-hydrolase [Patescibacteria group bacterium]|nr:MBL fold metallo-hydrolase [Patescibacteria group bacterium]